VGGTGGEGGTGTEGPFCILKNCCGVSWGRASMGSQKDERTKERVQWLQQISWNEIK
jgi:hypothetical protein